MRAQQRKDAMTARAYARLRGMMKRSQIFATMAAVIIASAAAHAEDAPAASPNKPVVAEKLREIRTKAARWQWMRARIAAVDSSGGSDVRSEGDVYWKSPNKFAIFLTVEGRAELDS